MKEVVPGVFIGNISDYRAKGEVSTLSACQTVHYERLNWTRRSVDTQSPHYLENRGEGWLTLNWVDGPAHLYSYGGPGAFLTALDFIDSNKPILVHCDQGKSRSATLGLLYLAKRARSISNASFEAARDDFCKLYPAYKPGGIANYVADHWLSIK